MKRNIHLVALSRDHHHGLLFCWKIRQGIALNIAAERILAYIRYFYETHLQPHFQEEETILFVASADPLCQRAINEHREIAGRIREITEGDADAPALLSLADLTDAHIRFEERVLFPHLEETLTATQLAGIGDTLQQLHANTPADTHADTFWIAVGKS
ncbi:hemerythrin domain-containing protein [Niabella soli]|uniref:Cation-binding protein n=1 Tax=Niabella soli DSM 19437 TaxID=929713 RepID=W0F560_9BACT|nr:hemerythrin domain-containing protein [Niabella soli]AHF16938.1 cation-binding protein [Niabella soli DSM 19437]